jgi:hypothetical protein
LGRNARIFKDGVVIGYGKNISVKASADLIKEYSMDALTPAIVSPGKQTFSWTAEKLYLNGEHMTSLLSGTEFDIVFAPTGSPTQLPYEEWTDCVILSVERSAGETGGVIEKIQGEAKGVTVHDA